MKSYLWHGTKYKPKYSPWVSPSLCGRPLLSTRRNLVSLPKTAQPPSAATTHTGSRLTSNLDSFCQVAQVVLSPIIDYRTSIMLVNLAIITHLCHQQELPLRAWNLFILTFNEFRVQHVFSATCIHLTVMSLLITWNTPWKTILIHSLFLKETSVPTTVSLEQKEEHLSPSDTAELFHIRKKIGNGFCGQRNPRFS